MPQWLAAFLGLSHHSADRGSRISWKTICLARATQHGPAGPPVFLVRPCQPGPCRRRYGTDGRADGRSVSMQRPPPLRKGSLVPFSS